MILLLQELRIANYVDDINYIENVYKGADLEQLRISEMLKKFDIQTEIKNILKQYSDNALNELKNLNSKAV